MYRYVTVLLVAIVLAIIFALLYEGADTGNDNALNSGSLSSPTDEVNGQRGTIDTEAKNKPSVRDVLPTATEQNSLSVDKDLAARTPQGLVVASDISPGSSADPTSSIHSNDMRGRPFPVSASVQRLCGGERNGAIDCPEVTEFLSKFANEARDDEWASSIEQRIRDLVAESRQPYAKVRIVECRTTRCALEVEAAQEFVITDIYPDPVLKRELDEWLGALGFENDGGQEAVVTLSTFYRKH